MLDPAANAPRSERWKCEVVAAFWLGALLGMGLGFYLAVVRG